MTSNDLRAAITELGLTQSEFARLLNVSNGAVAQWLSEARAIPGPAIAYVSLLMRSPSSLRQQEVNNVRKGTLQMRNGMYLIHFTGSDGDGYATLTFEDGYAYGFDTGGGQYDGTYTHTGLLGLVQVDIKVRMPPNVASVVGGVSQRFEWVLPVSTKLDLSADRGVIQVSTGLGPAVRAEFQRMRDLPKAA
ncbi:hypothetical protein GCM10010924_21910 [Rhizobium wenxiniae]|uniref:HTH cro/C1-type domain-containing protein n=1 Tax=Rhizobium wenxiniae TaxID=1737357 RepID=A0A7W9Y6Y1_9HYPH|nr:helix-turn-helix domain-containing protein [Rhizobium wenxiniae]MBB6163097.1 hypothetical protein [Rhizobium wenxiniae]GGF93448.1 hypothetical protein GCM10010924_21910 [Rhizobium wenxiniae]